MLRRLGGPPAAGLLVASALTGCTGGAEMPVKVSGPFGVRPEVSIPSGRPDGALRVTTLIEGRGARAARGGLVVADYASYLWNATGSKLLASSYAAGRPGAFPSGAMVPGLEKALGGARAGSRVAAMIPPRDINGARGAPQQRIAAGDFLVYVLDVRAVYPASAAVRGRARPAEPRLPAVSEAASGRGPSVTVPRGAPPRAPVVRTLIRGQGPVVTAGRLVALQYTGVFWRNGKVFDSSWRTGRPSASVVGVGHVIKGWDDGLVGRRIGSRMLLVVPPRWGYGGKGLAKWGITGEDTLVFVVDVLGAH